MSLSMWWRFTRGKTHQAVSQDECSFLNVSYALGRSGGSLSIEVPYPQHGPQTQCSHSNSFSVYYNSKEERCSGLWTFKKAWGMTGYLVVNPAQHLTMSITPQRLQVHHYRTHQVLWEIPSHLNPLAPPPPLLGSKIKHHTYIFKTFEKVLGCRLGVWTGTNIMEYSVTTSIKMKYSIFFSPAILLLMFPPDTFTYMQSDKYASLFSLQWFVITKHWEKLCINMRLINYWWNIMQL